MQFTTVDVKNMPVNQVKIINFTVIFIYQLLTSHYEQRWKYYLLTGGQDDQGLASEEELHLSRKLFWGVFKALDNKVIHIEYQCLSQDHLEII